MSVKRILTVATAIAAIALAGPVEAADANGKFVVLGLGGTPCSAFGEAIQKKDAAALNGYGSWILGYYSSYNRLVSGTFDAVPSIDLNTTISVVGSACRAMPKASLEQATFSVLKGFEPIRQQAESETVTLSNDGKTFVVRAETIKFVERRLKELGYYKSTETGKASPQLIQALKAFQTAQKIPTSGFPTLGTVARISTAK